MATPTFNRKSPTIKRILREAAELASSPSPDYHIAPLESNLFEWHFTIRGPPSTPYANGIYHGRITLPPTYPLRPPSFRFLTPSGRFEVNREICLSISGHHEDTWQPAWGVRTAVVALRGFMESNAGGQVGGLECSEDVRHMIAKESVSWRCDGCCKTNQEIIKESTEAAMQQQQQQEGTLPSKEEVIPAELKLAYRGEDPAGSGPGSAAGAGPVTPRTETSDGIPTPSTTTAASSPAGIEPLQQLPPYLNNNVHHATQQQQQQTRRVETPWLDKLIWSLVVVLGAIVARRLLA